MEAQENAAKCMVRKNVITVLMEVQQHFCGSFGSGSEEGTDPCCEKLSQGCLSCSVSEESDPTIFIHRWTKVVDKRRNFT